MQNLPVLLPEIRRTNINYCEDVLSFVVKFNPEQRQEQHFLMEVSALANQMEIYFAGGMRRRHDDTDPRFNVPRLKDWCQSSVQNTYNRNKFVLGPIHCQAVFGEMVTFELTGDGEKIDVRVKGAVPSNSEEFVFEIDLSDYNKLLLYLYMQSLVRLQSEGLKKLRKLVERTPVNP